MKNFLLKVMAVFLFVGLLSSGANAAEWTFMIYLDGDNNLEEAGIDDFLEIASVGSDSNINIVVQFDRIGGYDTSYGNWTTFGNLLFK